MESMPSYYSSSNHPQSFIEGDATYLPLSRTPSREQTGAWNQDRGYRMPTGDIDPGTGIYRCRRKGLEFI